MSIRAPPLKAKWNAPPYRVLSAALKSPASSAENGGFQRVSYFNRFIHRGVLIIWDPKAGSESPTFGDLDLNLSAQANSANSLEPLQKPPFWRTNHARLR
jgi:hypothetical protein